MKIDDVVGKRLLAGLTYVDDSDQIVERHQVDGTILRMNEMDGLVIDQSDGAGEFSLPPDLEALDAAIPGAEYKNRSTGQTVIAPDFVARWTISPPGDPNQT